MFLGVEVVKAVAFQLFGAHASGPIEGQQESFGLQPVPKITQFAVAEPGIALYPQAFQRVQGQKRPHGEPSKAVVVEMQDLQVVAQVGKSGGVDLGQSIVTEVNQPQMSH